MSAGGARLPDGQGSASGGKNVTNECRATRYRFYKPLLNGLSSSILKAWIKESPMMITKSKLMDLAHEAANFKCLAFDANKAYMAAWSELAQIENDHDAALEEDLYRWTRTRADMNRAHAEAIEDGVERESLRLVWAAKEVDRAHAEAIQDDYAHNLELSTMSGPSSAEEIFSRCGIGQCEGHR